MYLATPSLEMPAESFYGSKLEDMKQRWPELYFSGYNSAIKHLNEPVKVLNETSVLDTQDPAVTSSNELDMGLYERQDQHQLLANLANVRVDKFKACIDILCSSRPNLLLSGPPGTSKTFLAEKLTEHFFRSSEERKQRVTFVQFHPSYTYEQFVEGLYPQLVDDKVKFDVRPGKLRLAAECARVNAAERPGAILVIDELNRGNVAKIFGELLYLIEYRDKEIMLQHSDHSKDSERSKDPPNSFFSIPSNLAIIATMNTADRSIQSLDAAMRRRFNVVELPPDADVLESFYGDRANLLRGAELVALIRGFNQLNEQLRTDLSEDQQFGHANFLPHPKSDVKGKGREGTSDYEQFGPQQLQRRWKEIIYPQLREYFHGNRNKSKLDSYTFSSFWGRSKWVEGWTEPKTKQGSGRRQT